MKLGICGPIGTALLEEYLHASSTILPPGLGGTPVVSLVQSAVERGWEVIVFSLCPSLDKPFEIRGPRLKLVLGPYRSQGRARDFFRAERDFLAGAIRAEQPDVVHAHWTYEFALGALDSGVPAVITAHDRPLRVLRWDRTPYRAVRTVMAAMVARRATLLTAVSEPVANHFERYFRCRVRPRVIPNGLDRAWFCGEPIQASGPPVFASILTGWGPLKNAATLLKAFAEVRGKLPASHLLLFGTGHGRGEAAERWAASRELSGGVEFRGQVTQDELRRALRGAHALVHPSREESYSMTVAEAMALGVPVIASRGAGTIADSLEGGGCAVLTNGASPSAMAGDMIRLASSAALRAELAGRAREAAGMFHADRVLGEYAGAYRAAARS